MWSSSLALAVLSSGLLASAGPTPKTYTVSTSYATYAGNFTAPHTLSFLGIPYAEPPVGLLRFRRPASLNTQKFNKTEVIDAYSKYPDPCVQGALLGIPYSGGGVEDCLKVNIHMPINATPYSKLPVLFYIHGGGYVIGDTRLWHFEHWINQSPNFVVVSVYHRLSSFGFLSHPALSRASLGDNNVGYLDQITALKWVKENIRSFGGDPDHITINGEDAGAGAVQMHLIGEESRGLFHGAIAQSVDRMTMPTPEQQEDMFNYFAKEAGCGGYGYDSPSETIKCLRAAPVSVLQKAQDESSSSYYNGSRYNHWGPVMDGKTFRDFPTNLFKQGKFAKVPIMVGSTTDEVLSGTDPCTGLSQCLTSMYPGLDSKDIKEYQAIYSKSFSNQDLLVKTAIGETNLRCGRQIMGNAGVQAKTKTWSYRYAQPNPLSSKPESDVGAEIWMMFMDYRCYPNDKGVLICLSPDQKAFASELIAYWISFIRTGDPNVYKLPRSAAWPAHEKGSRAVLKMDAAYPDRSGITSEKIPADETKRCQFIADKSSTLQI